MSKKILIIMILMLIFGVNDVHAVFLGESYYIPSSELTSNSITKSLNGINIVYEFELQNQLIKNYDYLEGDLSVHIQNSNISFETDNINWDLTCYNWSSGYIPYSDATITYDDGSHASISYEEYVYSCSNWVADNQISASYENVDNHPFVSMIVLNSGGNWNACSVSSTGHFTCKIKNTNIKKFRITISKVTPTIHNAVVTLNRNLTFYNDTTTNIINNQNQNQQQQHQDSQDTQQKIDDVKNTITDSNVNGNNSSDTISSIGDSFNTENDFLLGLLTIPYTFWNSITNVFSNSCSPLNVGTMFEKPLIFPCIELNDYLGSVFTTIIDVIFSGIIMSAFVRRIIRYYQALLSLDNSATYIGGVKVW